MPDTDSVLSNTVPKSVTDGWITAAEFGSQIGRGQKTVDRYVRRGLPIIRIGRTIFIDPSAARRWFENGMPSAQQPVRRSA